MSAASCFYSYEKSMKQWLADPRSENGKILLQHHLQKRIRYYKWKGSARPAK